MAYEEPQIVQEWLDALIELARTKNEEYQYEGIRVIDIADWLIEE